MPNIIKKIDIESAYTKSHKAIELLISSRDERTLVWETEINEYIRRVERSEAISRVDGGQACRKDDSGNSAITVYGSSYY
jgi:hypothetical protein